MNIKKSLFSLFSLALIFSLNLVHAVDSYENQIVKKLTIAMQSNDPETGIDIKKIKSGLKTQENEPFSQSIFDTDLKNLSKKFGDIYPNIELKGNGLFITINVTPKPMITQINFVGNNRIKTSTLHKELGIKPGQAYSRDIFNKALNKVKELYTKKGFFESEVSYNVEPIFQKDQVIINIDIKEGRLGKIKDIVLKGLTKDEEKEVKSKLYTKRYNLYLSWLTGSGIYRTDAIDQDQMTITNFLNNKGYADARVSIEINEDPKTGKIILVILVHRGPLYHIGKVTFNGNKILSDEEIEKAISAKSGDLFSPEKIREISQAIKDLYGQKGYIDAAAMQETYLSESDPIYDIHFEISEGCQYKIGLIRVFGNESTNINVILRESLLTPGLCFDSRRLKATEARLQNIGYFKNVNVYAVKSEDTSIFDESYRDVYIEVEETTTGSANLSLGLSSMEDVYGSFELMERNFNIKGLTKIFSKGTSALRGAGEYANAKATIGQKQRSYFITWMDPYFRDSLWRFGFEVSSTMSQLQTKDYKVYTSGGSVFASYPITRYFTFGTKYRVRHSETNVKNYQKDDPATSTEDKEIEENHGIISAFSTFLAYDSTDAPYKAHRGLRSSLEGEFSGLGGDFYFFKLSFINTLYIPVMSKVTLKCRADMKFLEPTLNCRRKDIPYSEKYFLGGETTVRGYKPYILGDKSKKGNPLGGLSSTLLSAELAYHIARPADIFVFFDSGCVTKKHFSMEKFNSSYGFGIRLELMQRMPITIGWGYPINADSEDEKQGFFYSMGTQF